MGLRAADPASMKEFVVAVQQRTVELKASLSGNDGKPVDLGKRVGLISHITALLLWYINIWLKISRY